MLGHLVILCLFAVLSLFTANGCNEKNPPRNQIPVLKETLARLQTAVKDRNRASLDSLLSIEMLRYNQNGDSLIARAFGDDSAPAFDHFGDAVFLYTGDNAQIECWAMDSTSRRDRPLRIHMVREGKRWLVSHYTIPDSASANTEN